MNKKCVELLNSGNMTIATAESCTGGLIGKMITDVSGASAVYNMGFITYSNEAKTKLLGVPADVIIKHGAVSKETVVFMAKGARDNADSDIGIAVSGIAGPNSDGTEKPVGLVYIGFSAKEGNFYLKCLFDKKLGRDGIRKATANKAFEIIISYLTDCEHFVKNMKFLNFD